MVALFPAWRQDCEIVIERFFEQQLRRALAAPQP